MLSRWIVRLIWVGLLACSVVTQAGCSITKDIALEDAQGRQTVCEGVTGIYGVRSQTLLAAQRRCVRDYQQAGYARMPEAPK